MLTELNGQFMYGIQNEQIILIFAQCHIKQNQIQLQKWQQYNYFCFKQMKMVLNNPQTRPTSLTFQKLGFQRGKEDPH